MKEVIIKEYWQDFLAYTDEKTAYSAKKYTAWHFCNDEQSANNLADLVIAGIKRGTASLYEGYAYENEEIPQVGSISIILDWQGNPRCIIETIKIDMYKFKDVPETFAKIEGEGDKSLKYWREVHNDFFREDAAEFGFDFNDDSMVICEEFKVIYKK